MTAHQPIAKRSLLDELYADAPKPRERCMNRQCPTCGVSFRPPRSKSRFCSQPCSHAWPRRKPIADRFWPKVAKLSPGECWPFQASTDRKGYGKIGLAKGVMAYAHRVAWELANRRRIPPGRIVCHSCDNPSCCNPAHLWLGTIADNNRDMSAKGRNHQQQKTHCPRGHEYTAENTRRGKHGRGFAYPVHRDYFCSSKPLAVFDTWGEAADYAMQNNLFMGDPLRRAS